MILTIDVGNTRIKGAVFEGNILVEDFVFMKTEHEKKIQNINKFSTFVKNYQNAIHSTYSDKAL